MIRSEYKDLMAKIADGGKVNQKTFDDLMEFAKKNKTKRPPADAVVDHAAVKEAATTVKDQPKPAKAKKAAEPKAKKEPKPKAQCSVKDCDVDSRAGGMCATHYSRLIYRAQPDKAEKAREASKKYAARKRAEKKAAAESESAA